MDEEAFQQSIRKFLRTVGMRSQQEIEKAVASARADGSIGDARTVPASMVLEVPGLKLRVSFDGEIHVA